MFFFFVFDVLILFLAKFSFQKKIKLQANIKSNIAAPFFRGEGEGEFYSVE